MRRPGLLVAVAPGSRARDACRRRRRSCCGRPAARCGRGAGRCGHRAQDRIPPGAASPDSGPRRRSPGKRLARRDRGHPLRRAAALAASRLHPLRPARLAPVVPDPEPFLRAVADASGSRAGPGCGDRLRGGRRSPGARRKDPRLTELRRRLCRGRHARPWNLRRGSHCRGRRKRHRHRGSRAVGRAAGGEGRHAVADDLDRGRGEGDPLGGRERGTGDQPEPRRHPRSAGSRPGQLLPARSRRRRLRRLERSRRGRGRGQRRPGALEPVAVRELSRGLAARPRRQRARRDRRYSEVLESRQGVQRPGRARGQNSLDLPATADVALPRLCRAGLLELRAGGVSRGAGNLLRRSAGVRRRRAPARPSATAPPRAGDGDPRADGGRRQRDDRLRRLPPWSRRALRPRPFGRRGSHRCAGGAAAARRPLRGQRRRGLARVQALGVESPDQRGGRLLGRPGRRLRDPARRRASEPTWG